MVFLVGVDHRIQFTTTNCGSEWAAIIQAFEDYLVSHALELSLDLLGEEFNEERLAHNRARAGTVRDAAARANCMHCLCEPIRTVTDHVSAEARERAWLECLNNTDATRIQFVCGSGHLSTFAARLQLAGYATSELSRDWGADWHSYQ